MIRCVVSAAAFGRLCCAQVFARFKTTSAEYVASRARDPTFEKLMDKYKNLLKVVSIQDLILANPNKSQPSVSIEFLNRLSQRLHLNRGAASFLRRYPHIFDIFYDPVKSQPYCKLTDTATNILHEEAAAIEASLSLALDRLVRILAISESNSLPLRAIFKVWRELGLPDDFEESLISQNLHLFKLGPGNEPNTHVLELVDGARKLDFVPSIDKWRVEECCREDCSVDRTDIRYSFKHGYPPGMRLSKNFRSKVKEWQKLPYIGPYEEMSDKKRGKAGTTELEKRAVAIVHEFLSLTVEKMVEVEKISHFRRWFGINLNIRDLFLDHPGIFYMSTKGKRHTVFLREAYERGCLIIPNPVYESRRRLLDLVALGRRGTVTSNFKLSNISNSGEAELQEDDNS